MDIYKKRLKSIREMLKNEGVSSFLISNNIRCEYVSSLRSSNQYLLLSESAQVLITDFRYRQIAKEICEKQNFKYVELTSDGLGAALIGELKDSDVLGIESDDLTVDQFDKISEELGNIKIKKISGQLPKYLALKSEEELHYMGKAASIADNAFSKFVNKVAAGMTEVEAAFILEDFCREEGSEGVSFSTIVLFGERSALPHGTPSERTLKHGDYILCDFGCTINGYCSDMTRTLIFGSGDQKQKEIYNIVNEARSRAVDAVKAGVTASSVDKVARDFIEGHGYGEMFGHGTGHGVGREVHEFPAVNSRNDTILEDGMVITIEPGIYIPDYGGVRVEDMVLVKKDGAKLLSGFTRDLIELEEGSEI